MRLELTLIKDLLDCAGGVTAAVVVCGGLLGLVCSTLVDDDDGGLVSVAIVDDGCCWCLALDGCVFTFLARATDRDKGEEDGTRLAWYRRFRFWVLVVPLPPSSWASTTALRTGACTWSSNFSYRTFSFFQKATGGTRTLWERRIGEGFSSSWWWRRWRRRVEDGVMVDLVVL